MVPPEAQSFNHADAIPEVRTWERFFKTYYREHINEAVLGYPDRRSLFIDFFDLERFDHDLAQHLLDQPDQALMQAAKALETIDMPMEPRPTLNIRVKHLPETNTIEVRALRAEHMGRLVAVKGLVKKASEVRPKIRDAVFQHTCGCFIKEPQDEHLVLKEPEACYEEQGGCGKEGRFKLITQMTRGEVSTFVDTQKLEIQEAPEQMRGGEQPQRLNLFCEDDLGGTVRPGERIVLNGILRSAIRRDRGVKSTLFDIFVDANSFEREEHEFEEIETTEEEEAQIRELSRHENVITELRGAIAPTLFGMEFEKMTLLLQLFGGVEKKLPDGTRLRGDIHVLMVGDPGVAKSQLIRYMSGLAPRGIYTSGKSSSGAGLTAAAVKDDFGDGGRWTLEAGAMVLADRGLLCVDEIDKMSKDDQSSMHEGMEQQSISIAKAGITATLQSRCSVLGAANPKAGRFDEFQPISDQINFPPALLSRFDVIFVLRDKPNAEHDAKLAQAILGTHRGGAMYMRSRANEEVNEEEMEGLLSKIEPAFSKEFLRKYVAYAKRSCHPVLSEEARQHLVQYYVKLRKGNSEEDSGAIPLTARQLEALVRLSEASARVRLSPEAGIDDACRAIDIFEYYMRRIGAGEGGIMDIDMVASGQSTSQRNFARTIKDVVRDLEAGTDHGAEFPDVINACEAQGVPPDKARALIERMIQQGELMRPRDNHLRVVR